MIEREHTEERKGKNSSSFKQLRKHQKEFVLRRSEWGSSTTSSSEMIPLSIFNICNVPYFGKNIVDKHNFIFNFLLSENFLNAQRNVKRNFSCM